MKTFRLLATTIIATSIATSAHSLPVGGKVTSGSATINPVTNNTLNIDQHSSKVYINWTDFSSQAGEAINFNQKTSDLAVNRVTGNQVSYLRGSLTAPGKIVLINENGVVFTGTSQVNVGALQAIAAKASGTSYDTTLKGSWVENSGTINATDSVTLIGDTVYSNGTTTAANNVTLAGRNIINTEISKVNAKNVDIHLASKITPNYTTFKPTYAAGSVHGLANLNGNITGANVNVYGYASDKLARSTINLNGVVDSRNLTVSSSGNINAGGTIISDDTSAYAAPTKATPNIYLKSLQDVNLDHAYITATNNNGDNALKISATHDVNLNGHVTATSTKTGTAAYIHAGNDLNTPAYNFVLNAKGATGADLSANHDINFNDTINANSNVAGQGAVTLRATNNLNTGPNSYISSGTGKINLQTTKGDINLGGVLYSQDSVKAFSEHNLTMTGNLVTSNTAATAAKPTLYGRNDVKVSGVISSSSGIGIGGGNVDLSGANISLTNQPNATKQMVQVSASRQYKDDANTKISAPDNSNLITIRSASLGQYNGTYSANSTDGKSPAGQVFLRGGLGARYNGNAFTMDGSGAAAKNVTVEYGGVSHLIKGDGPIAAHLPAKY